MAHLEERGHTVFALHINYMSQPDCYAILREHAVENGVNYIIGSSFGGYLGFWLAEELGIPCLLFNPAMRLEKYKGLIPLEIERKCPKRFVVIGAQDDTVLPEIGWDFFGRTENQAPYQRVIQCQWLGHRFDMDTFEGMVRWVGL